MTVRVPCLHIEGPLDGITREYPDEWDSVDIYVNPNGRVTDKPFDVVAARRNRRFVYARVTFNLPDTCYRFMIPADVQENLRIGWVLWKLTTKYQQENNNV